MSVEAKTETINSHIYRILIRMIVSAKHWYAF